MGEAEMTFTAVVTAHDYPFSPIVSELEHMQDRPPDEIIVLFSGDCRPRPDVLVWQFVDLVAKPAKWIMAEDDKKDWGHDKRERGLLAAHGDYVGFFNADDKYHSQYIEKMMAAAEERDAGFVYCYWHPMGKCTPTLGSSTSGNFIVRRDVALEAGYTDRQYEADGMFIDRCVAVCKKRELLVVEVPEVLYYHNGRK